MSHLSMSINQMLHSNDTATTRSPPTPTRTIDEKHKKLTGKVKIFYTFKGSDTHCLCSFDMTLDDFQDRNWVSVPLKQCLLSVCSSCPDQLQNNNTAIYSANFEESLTVENWSPLHDSKSNIIWEGHGLLSNILNDDEHHSNDAQVTGKIASDSTMSNSKYDCIIEVLIQLHPVRHSPLLSSADQQQPAQTQSQKQQQQQQYLPPMRSLWNESMNHHHPYSPPPSSSSNTNRNSTSPPTLHLDRPSPPSTNQHHHRLSSPRQPPLHLFQQQQYQREEQPRLPSFSSTTSSPIPTREMKDQQDHYYKHLYPPALDPSWPGNRHEASSFDHEMIKRRKLSSTSAVPASIIDLPNSNSPHKKVMNNRHSTPNNHHHHAASNTSLLANSTSTDTYYHQSRRKKRDTKPPNANDIRPFVEVEKAQDGSYILPAEVDSWTVLNLGSVVWDRAAFHNQRYIYPVGYRVKKWYRSMVDPHSDTQYTCEILDGGDEPIFQLNADDNPTECWRGPTPTTVWTIAVRRAFAIRNMDYGHNPVGPDFFGLRKNTIAKMIQDLPNADKCKNYIWQNFEAMSNNKGKSVRRSNTRLSSSSSTGSTHPDRLLSNSPPTSNIKNEGI